MPYTGGRIENRSSRGVHFWDDTILFFFRGILLWWYRRYVVERSKDARTEMMVSGSFCSGAGQDMWKAIPLDSAVASGVKQVQDHVLFNFYKLREATYINSARRQVTWKRLERGAWRVSFVLPYLCTINHQLYCTIKHDRGEEDLLRCWPRDYNPLVSTAKHPGCAPMPPVDHIEAFSYSRTITRKCREKTAVT